VLWTQHCQKAMFPSSCICGLCCRQVDHIPLMCSMEKSRVVIWTTVTSTTLLLHCTTRFVTGNGRWRTQAHPHTDKSLPGQKPETPFPLKIATQDRSSFYVQPILGPKPPTLSRHDKEAFIHRQYYDNLSLFVSVVVQNNLPMSKK